MSSDILVTTGDGSQYLVHHGVLGMKWGVRNADTLRKYAGAAGRTVKKHVRVRPSGEHVNLHMDKLPEIFDIMTSDRDYIDQTWRRDEWDKWWADFHEYIEAHRDPNIISNGYSSLSGLLNFKPMQLPQPEQMVAVGVGAAVVTAAAVTGYAAYKHISNKKHGGVKTDFSKAVKKAESNAKKSIAKTKKNVKKMAENPEYRNEQLKKGAVKYGTMGLKVGARTGARVVATTALANPATAPIATVAIGSAVVGKTVATGYRLYKASHKK